jgi:hypothetical protein
MKVSVLIATYNRAQVLRQTLEAMCAVDREGLDVEFVVIDNNSTDDTAQVIDSFAERLHLHHLFESRPGKSYALNYALDTVELGEIVVFTDDDVVPQEDWLKRIVRSSEKWPEHDVFGGKIEVVWPEGMRIPTWVMTNQCDMRMKIFGEHDYGPRACPYPPGAYPFGGNFWVRGKLLHRGQRFAMTLGPQRSAPMGEDTDFVSRLAESGHPAFYVPEAVVGHLAQPCLLQEEAVYVRARRLGRAKANIMGIADADGYGRNRFLWHFRVIKSILRCYVRCVFARMSFPEEKRVERTFGAYRFLGYNVESLRLAHKTKGDRRTER